MKRAKRTWLVNILPLLIVQPFLLKLLDGESTLVAEVAATIPVDIARTPVDGSVAQWCDDTTI